MPVFALPENLLAEASPWWVTRDAEWGGPDGTRHFAYALIAGNREPKLVAGCYSRRQMADLCGLLRTASDVLDRGDVLPQITEGRWAISSMTDPNESGVAILYWLPRPNETDVALWKPRWRFMNGALLQLAATVLDQALVASSVEPDRPRMTNATLGQALGMASTRTLSLLADLLSQLHSVRDRNHPDHPADHALVTAVRDVLASRGDPSRDRQEDQHAASP